MSSRSRSEGFEWAADASYQSLLWWDVETELAYKVQESYGENFESGRFSEEEKNYVHDIQARIQRSFVFSPKLAAEISYDYQFGQDLLQTDDYEVIQAIELEVDYDINPWLTTNATFKRDVEDIYPPSPEEKEESLNDTIILGFAADPVDWLTFKGDAEWAFTSNVSAPPTGMLVITNWHFIAPSLFRGGVARQICRNGIEKCSRERRLVNFGLDGQA